MHGQEKKQLEEFFYQEEMWALAASVTGTFEIYLWENNLFFRY